MTENIESPLRFIRMKSGEDIIAETLVMELNTGNVMMRLIKPMKILYMPTGEGGIHIGLMSWIFPDVSPAKEFYIDAKEVLVLATVSPKLEEHYVRAHITESNEIRNLSDDELMDEALDAEEYKDEDVAYIKEIMKDIKSGRKKLN